MVHLLFAPFCSWLLLANMLRSARVQDRGHQRHDALGKMHLVWSKVDERALPGARNSFTGLAGGIAEVEMQRMHAKLATGDHSAAEDGHQQALAVARRQRQILDPTRLWRDAPALWRIVTAALAVKKPELIRSDGRQLPY
jgi:hypothetical protein